MTVEKKTIAYLACPYSHPDPLVKKMRLRVVTWFAFELIKAGEFVYSPLTHNIPIDEHGFHGNWLTWKHFDHNMLSRCDKLIVLKLPGWEQSEGVTAEIAYAQALNLPIEWRALSEERVESSSSDSIYDLTKRLLDLYEERDWAQFHSPKNLAINLGVEVGELMEHFRWLTEEQSYVKDSTQLMAIRDEIGDVFLNILHLAHQLNIDPLQAAHDKLTKINVCYPLEKCKGKSAKYTAYQN